MDDSHPFCSMSIVRSIHEIRLFQTLTLKLQSQGNGCDQRAKSYSQPSILLTRFLFISHQSDQQFLRYRYFEIWPWNIQGQGHEWGKKVKVTYCTQYPTDALPFRFTSIGQPFLRYGQNSFWPWRNTSEIFKQTTIFDRIFPRSSQVITMTRAIKLLRFVVIGWVILTFSCRQPNFC